ncbi:FRIGIDA-like protein 3 [Elaeis guineensis]|uniref:FRIGIDA-like protein n=1 Tax=Elaeis guineensis var. tenera TaxID=51953 RepID=A0A6I9RPF1_ELAGV|nr:FRIGIDA-like protein 3 [Elaeis guineensis]
MPYGRIDSSRPLPGFSAMADTQSVATLIDFTTSKLQQLQQAFSELESHSAISLNLKWKELEEHFHGLEKSLKNRFHELEDQEKDYVTKVAEAQEMLEKQEAVVVAKELTLLDRLQEKRDSALSTIFEKQKSAPSEPIINGMSSGVPDSVVEENLDVKIAKSCTEDVNPGENGNADAKPHSELMKLCEEMDAEGLQKFISDNRKNLSSIREEIPSALRSATNPFSLVLDSLKDFYTGEILGLDGKKDGNLLGLRRTCLMLMESLEQLQADSVLDSLSDNQMLTSEIREQAKVIATEWKPKLDDLDIDASSGNSLEAHAFLQLLATFGIASEFDRDEICKLIPAVTRRRQAVDLCRSLGLSHKMPGVIEVLLNSGRQIEAVNLAYAFELTEQYAPVPLLKAYLKEARKVSQIKAGNMSPGGQNETNERELSALKAIMKCIEEHKLEEQYPTDPLQKRILQLEKAKADKRRAAEAAKPQSKRPRANGTTYAPRVTSIPDKSFYRAPPERYPYPYDRQYVYPAETHHPALMGSAPYTISPTHTTYYGNGYQVQYQAAYLH